MGLTWPIVVRELTASLKEYQMRLEKLTVEKYRPMRNLCPIDHIQDLSNFVTGKNGYVYCTFANSGKYHRCWGVVRVALLDQHYTFATVFWLENLNDGTFAPSLGATVITVKGFSTACEAIEFCDRLVAGHPNLLSSQLGPLGIDPDLCESDWFFQTNLVGTSSSNLHLVRWTSSSTSYLTRRRQSDTDATPDFDSYFLGELPESRVTHSWRGMSTLLVDGKPWIAVRGDGTLEEDNVLWEDEYWLKLHSPYLEKAYREGTPLDDIENVLEECCGKEFTVSHFVEKEARTPLQAKEGPLVQKILHSAKEDLLASKSSSILRMKEVKEYVEEGVALAIRRYADDLGYVDEDDIHNSVLADTLEVFGGSSDMELNNEDEPQKEEPVVGPPITRVTLNHSTLNHYEDNGSSGYFQWKNVAHKCKIPNTELDITVAEGTLGLYTVTVSGNIKIESHVETTIPRTFQTQDEALKFAESNYQEVVQEVAKSAAESWADFVTDPMNYFEDEGE